jgi:hypothetical protein
MSNSRNSFSHSRNSKGGKLLDTFLTGVSQEEKTRILEVLYEHDIAPDDPMFLIFAAMTEAKHSVAPIPEQLRDLQKGIEAASLAFYEEVKTSLKRHEELNHSFYVAAERLSAIFNRELVEIERHQKHRRGALSISVKTALLWGLVTSAIGGIAGALLILTLSIIAAR